MTVRILKNWLFAMRTLGALVLMFAVVVAPTAIPCALFGPWGMLGLPGTVALFVLIVVIAGELEDAGW